MNYLSISVISHIFHVQSSLFKKLLRSALARHCCSFYFITRVHSKRARALHAECTQVSSNCGVESDAKALLNCLFSICLRRKGFLLNRLSELTKSDAPKVVLQEHQRFLTTLPATFVCTAVRNLIFVASRRLEVARALGKKQKNRGFKSPGYKLSPFCLSLPCIL